MCFQTNSQGQMDSNSFVLSFKTPPSHYEKDRIYLFVLCSIVMLSSYGTSTITMTTPSQMPLINFKE